MHDKQENTGEVKQTQKKKENEHVTPPFTLLMWSCCCWNCCLCFSRNCWCCCWTTSCCRAWAWPHCCWGRGADWVLPRGRWPRTSLETEGDGSGRPPRPTAEKHKDVAGESLAFFKAWIEPRNVVVFSCLINSENQSPSRTRRRRQRQKKEKDEEDKDEDEEMSC